MEKIKAYGLCIYKIIDDEIKILLCKSVTSKKKWGCLKGLALKDENPIDCAQREVYEESRIKVDPLHYEEYFEQENDLKDIGLWLVNAKNIRNINRMFFEDTLKNHLLSWENSKVKFFDIDNLPDIKTKQSEILEQITDFLRNKNQFH